MNAIKSAKDIVPRTSEYLRSELVGEAPSWYRVLAFHPPLSAKTKKIRPEVMKKSKEQELATLERIKTHSKDSVYYKTRYKPHQLKTNFYSPQKLHFVEDELRDLFYKQHPWELADPKSMIENENDIDIGAMDWSHMKQYTKKLDGESVVQRTLYLTNEKGLSMLDAYEQAKFEYYRLKIEEETEQGVATEQSEMYGAVYGKSMIDHGFEKEMKVLSKWKEDALKLTSVLEAKVASMKTDSSVGVEAEEAAKPEEGATEEDLMKEFQEKDEKKQKEKQ